MNVGIEYLYIFFAFASAWLRCPSAHPSNARYWRIYVMPVCFFSCFSSALAAKENRAQQNSDKTRSLIGMLCAIPVTKCTRTREKRLLWGKIFECKIIRKHHSNQMVRNARCYAAIRWLSGLACQPAIEDHTYLDRLLGVKWWLLRPFARQMRMAER